MSRASIREFETPDAGADLSWHSRNMRAVTAGLDWIGLVTAQNSDVSAEAASNAYQAARAEMRDAGAPAAIDRLSALFRLAPFDEDVLLLALSSQLYGRPKVVTPQSIRATLCGG